MSLVLCEQNCLWMDKRILATEDKKAGSEAETSSTEINSAW